MIYTSKYMFDRACEIAGLKLDCDMELRDWREKRRQGKVTVELDDEYVNLAERVIGVSVEASFCDIGTIDISQLQ